MSDDQLSIRRKRLLYRSQHRGFKEADLLIGGFVAGNLAAMSAAELDQLEVALAESDHDIYDWYLERWPVPATVDSPVMRRLLSFRLH